MKAHEIAKYPLDPRRGEEWLSLFTAQNMWLREIAYQIASFNDILASDVNIHIHTHGNEQQDFSQLLREIIAAMKQLTDEASKALLDALAQMGSDIIAGAEAAAKTETDQIIAFLKNLQNQNGPITIDDIGGVIDMIKGVAPKVKESVAASIDAISTKAGADTGNGGTTPPTPGPTP